MKNTVYISSGYNFWHIEIRDAENERVIHSEYWSHDDYESGVGGERQFAKILEHLGYHVEVEDSY